MGVQHTSRPKTSSSRLLLWGQLNLSPSVNLINVLAIPCRVFGLYVCTLCIQADLVRELAEVSQLVEVSRLVTELPEVIVVAER